MSIDNTRAAYRVINPYGFYSDNDTLYTVDEFGDPAEIYYDGEPNEGLEPLNILAHQRMTAFLEKLDAEARLVAEKTGRPFVGRPRNLDGGLAMATAVARNEMSIMGTKNKPATTDLVNPPLIPETGSLSHNPKRGRGRPPKNIRVAA